MVTLHFLAPFGGLRGNAVHFRLIGMDIADFLFVLTELFC